MKKESIIEDLENVTIKGVSDYLKKIETLVSSRDCFDEICVYRGEPEIYDKPCIPNLFRTRELDYNIFFEKSLFDTMRQNGLTGENKYLDNAIDAQHGEFPSRLLDVTYNCLIALYFAVTPYYHYDERELDKNDGMVYVIFSDKIYSPSAENINCCYNAIINRDKTWFNDNIIFESNHKLIDHAKKNARIIAQQGAFVLFQGNDASPIPKYMMYGIKIPSSAKKGIRKELAMFFGIHTGSVFPEVVNLVRELREKSKKINTMEFSLRNELDQIVKHLRKEVLHYMSYVCENSGNFNVAIETIYLIEKTINNCRVGLLELEKYIYKNMPDKGFLLEEYNEGVKLYNDFIKEYNRLLVDAGLETQTNNNLMITVFSKSN